MENVQTLLKQAYADIDWLRANREKIMLEHEHEFVAIRKERILDADKNFNILLRRLRKKGNDPGKLMIHYMTDEQTILTCG